MRYKMEMEGEQYSSQITCFIVNFINAKKEPDFCLMQSRVLRQSDVPNGTCYFFGCAEGLFLYS